MSHIGESGFTPALKYPLAVGLFALLDRLSVGYCGQRRPWRQRMALAVEDLGTRVAHGGAHLLGQPGKFF
jgi:hypothetical protein